MRQNEEFEPPREGDPSQFGHKSGYVLIARHLAGNYIDPSLGIGVPLKEIGVGAGVRRLVGEGSHDIIMGVVPKDGYLASGA